MSLNKPDPLWLPDLGARHEASQIGQPQRDTKRSAVVKYHGNQIAQKRPYHPCWQKREPTSSLSERALAAKYDITRATVRKWKKRDTVEDRSHRPRNLRATLSPLEEEIVVELSTSLLLPLDDLLAVVREFINPNMSHSALGRCLGRHELSNPRQTSRRQKRRWKKG